MKTIRNNQNIQLTQKLSVLITWPLLLAGLIAAPNLATAQTEYWDPTFTQTSAGGGAGTWSTATNWFNGTSDVAWTTGDIASFGGGTVGTVTLSATETANGVTFTTAGYTIGGSSTLTLAGTPTITVPSSGTDTMTCAIAGTVPVTVGGSGTLILSHANTGLTAGMTINSGATVVISNLSAAGTGTIADSGILNVVTAAGVFTAPLTGSGVVNATLTYATGSANYRYTGTSLAAFNGTVNLIAGLSGGLPGTGQVIMTNTVSSSLTWNVGSGATLDLVSTPGVTFPASVIINGPLTKKAEPPPTRDVNRDSGTDSANGGWARCWVLHNA